MVEDAVPVLSQWLPWRRHPARALACSTHRGCTPTLRVGTHMQGRYVTVLKHEGKLHCLDSVCFHAGGPLALGDVEELPSGEPCLRCPWHYYYVALGSGEKFYQGTVQGPDGKLLPGPWKR